MGGYIYLICDPSNNSYKIGVTRNINSNRIKKLQTGNSTELHIVKTYKCEFPFRLEKMLHFKFSNKHILNEWFNLSIDDIINFEKTCIELNNQINILKSNPFFGKNLV